MSLGNSGMRLDPTRLPDWDSDDREADSNDGINTAEKYRDVMPRSSVGHITEMAFRNKRNANRGAARSRRSIDMPSTPSYTELKKIMNLQPEQTPEQLDVSNLRPPKLQVSEAGSESNRKLASINKVLVVVLILSAIGTGVYTYISNQKQKEDV